MVSKNIVEVIIVGKDKATGVAKGIASAFRGIGKAAFKMAGAGLLATGALVAGLAKLAIDAAPVQNIITAFDAMTVASGKTSAGMLEDMQQASMGMVTNTDLMKQYNLATQLVSQQFANELPNAMGSLSKVAAATGQDLGFMTQSLITGVGRLSPMILDNLGITVDMAQANEDWADSNGVLVSEMTKANQQAAIFAQVQERLAVNTAALPDIMGTAAQKLEAFKTTIKNTKDAIGVALLPILIKVIDKLKAFGQAVLPVIKDLGKKLVPIIDKLKIFFGNIKEGVTKAGGLSAFLKRLIPPVILSALDRVGRAFKGLFEALAESWPQIQAIIQDFVSWFSASVVPLLGSALLLVGEIIEWLTDLWREHGDTVIGALEFIIDIFKNVFVAVFKAALSIIRGLLALFSGDFEGFKGHMLAAWGSLVEGVKAIVEPIWEKIKELWGKAIDKLKTTATEKFEVIKSVITEKLQPLIDFFNKVRDAILAVAASVKKFLTKLKELADVKLPSWLPGQSPPPMAKWFTDISDAMSMFNASTGNVAFVGGAGGSSLSNTFPTNVTVQVVYQPLVSTADEEEASRVLNFVIEEGIRKYLERRG